MRKKFCVAKFYPLILGILLGITTNTAMLVATVSKPEPKISIRQSLQNIYTSIPGTFGISALHLESGQRVEINANQRFPMASTYKIPIALYALSLIDSGTLDGQHKKIIKNTDRRRYCFVTTGQSVSVNELVQLMVEKSDNATSDIILKMVGGGKAVTRWLRKHNIDGINVDRSTLKMLADYAGIAALGSEETCTTQHYSQLVKKVTKDKRAFAAKKFYTDARDTTTPRAMVDLLVQAYQGTLVSEQSTKFLLNSMLHCTIKKRMVRFLPTGTKIWHKTGAIDGIVSDVGIIQLPDDKGHLVLALYTNNSVTHTVQREEAMARISKKIFDYFARS